MKLYLRTYLSIALALMLALTGQSMAIARGTSDSAGQMVLCTGTGLITVFVDENGDPTGAPYICPDCALNFLTATTLPEMVVLPDNAGPVVLPIRTTYVRRNKLHTWASARAPPRLI
jgi:hypothetical protein